MRHKRKILALGMLILAVMATMTPPSQATTAQPTMTGQAVPELASFERFLTGFMAQWNIPGASLAIMKDGRLLYARGFGVADRETNEPVQPTSLFRIASVSKPITAVATLTLVEDGRLDLDARVFEILDLQPLPGTATDPRIADMTVQDLLQHSAGWRTDSDPMFESNHIAQAMGIEGPPSCAQTIRFMLGQPLAYAPGTGYAYSNFGYCVLGEVIAEVSGQPYEAFVQSEILAPLGITDMQIGRSLPQDRADGEVRYYAYQGAPKVESVFPNVPGPVDFPYGGFHLEAMAAHGGWIGSAVDLLKFVAAVDGTRTPMTLSPMTVERMFDRPQLTQWNGAPSYYAWGWNVHPIGGGEANFWHDGALPYSTAKLVRTGDGVSWAVLLNSHPAPSAQGSYLGHLDQGLGQAYNQVTRWPEHDLFDPFFGEAIADNAPPSGAFAVCASGCPFASIQGAIDATEDGATIEIASGTYQETLFIGNRRDLTLVGAGRAATILDASPPGPNSAPSGITVEDSQGIAIEHLTIANGDDTGLTSLGNSGITIRTGAVRNNRLENVYIGGTSTVRVEGAEIAGSIERQGIAVDEDASLTLVDSRVTGNARVGVDVLGASQALIEGSVLLDNAWDGLMVRGEAEATVQTSTIDRNGNTGIWVLDAGLLTITDSRVNGNHANPEGSNGLGIVLLHQSDADISHNVIQGNAGCGVGLFEDQGIAIFGEGNDIAENGEAPLCGSIQKIPAGFGGGR